jgi:hypothetical protein
MLKKVSDSADALYFLASEDKAVVQAGHYYYLTHKTEVSKHATKKEISSSILSLSRQLIQIT